MEELFGNLDEDVFSEAKCRDDGSRLVSYNAKFCPQEWFSDVRNVDDCSAEDKIQIFKYKADLALHKKQFNEAFVLFTKLLDFVKSTNLPLLRDIEESRARCLLALDQAKDALHTALHLYTESMNYDQKTNILSLLVKCYQQLGIHSAVIICLGRLLALHPLNPDHWIQLSSAIKSSSLNTQQPNVFTNVHRNQTENVRNSTKTGADVYLYNPQITCRPCLQHYPSCSIYRHHTSENSKTNKVKECSSTCSKQNLEPVVHLSPSQDSRGCTDICQLSSERDCNQSNTSSKTYSTLESEKLVANKNLPNNEDNLCKLVSNCDIQEYSSASYCDGKSDQTNSVNDSCHESVPSFENCDSIKTTAVCLCLKRARYLLKNIELNAVGYVKDRYQRTLKDVEEQLDNLPFSQEEKLVSDKWVMSDFGFDPRAVTTVAKASYKEHENNLTVGSDLRSLKPEQVVDSSDEIVSLWLLHQWFTASDVK